MNTTQTLLKGIIKENPVLVLLLGTCPTLAVTADVKSAVGMAAAAAVVLILSNLAISLLRNIIPDKVRIPCYIVVIAGFVTVVEMLMHAFFPDIYSALGIFLSLIVVNCIILGRAEMFASKNGVVASVMDGIGMAIGFALALVAMATIREVFGAGTFFGMEIPFIKNYTIPILTSAPGGFFVFGLLIAISNRIQNNKRVVNCLQINSDEITINKKNVVLSIFFSFITLGFYSFFWLYSIVKNIYSLKQDKSSCFGEFCCILFVPFYFYYWWYSRIKATNEKLKEYNLNTIGNPILYVIISVLSLNIINLSLIQHKFNTLPTKEKIISTRKPKAEFGCEGCPSAAACNKTDCEKEAE